MSKKQEGVLLEVGTNEVEFLRFSLAGQVFGINVSKIRQVMVFQPEQVVPIPGTPDVVLGQYSYRGDPIPVIDLSKHLKKNCEDRGGRRLFLVCEFSLTKVAFVVDGVDRIVRCSWESFKPLEQTTFGQSSASIVGTIFIKDEMVPVVDIEAVLTELIPSSGIEGVVLTDEDKNAGKLDKSSVSIVYADDSPIVRKALLGYLNQAGFERVKTFNNGHEALTYMLQEGRAPVDLVISDIEMPRMDGLTFCKNLKAAPACSKIPLIFFSSTVTDEMQRKCKQVGGDRAYSKPEIKKIVRAISELLGAV
jgi:two-component system chemotaxis response regulator CheV